MTLSYSICKICRSLTAKLHFFLCPTLMEKLSKKWCPDNRVPYCLIQNQIIPRDTFYGARDMLTGLENAHDLPIFHFPVAMKTLK